jgi:DNA polymerase III delta subunit
MIYIYYGKDTFELEKEIDEHTKDGVEINSFESKDIETAVSNLVTQSFFNPKRVFILKDIFTDLGDKKEDSVIMALSNLPTDTTVIFVETKLPKKTKLTDFIKKEGEIKNFEEAKSINLVSFIKERVAEEGGEIAPLAAERLATFVGPNKWQLSEEINKLVLYKKGDGETEPIDTADVDLLVKANFDANIFALMDAFAAKNSRRAAELLNSFLDYGENEIYILTMIEKQFRNIAMAKFEDNISEMGLSKKAGLHPFVAKKSLSQARNFEKSEIVEMYGRLIDADLKLKSGFEPKQILLRLVL